ncbi:sulfatase [Puniceicoccaceae bacterium K14]|nr:sulfatase [Puniceicoccaceae bacterium K14]
MKHSLAFLLTLLAHIFITSALTQEAERPNILWLVSEDNSVDWLGCYGNENAKTPHLDKLAREGFRYTKAYANAPVCAPSRSTWITGIHSISMGTHPMRSRHLIPHDDIQYYPDLLRKNGYFTANFKKTDYNIGGRADKTCWDNPDTLDWQSLTSNQPFFQVINFGSSHESKAQGDVNNTLHDTQDTQLRAYHPDIEAIRKNYAKYHDAVSKMDSDIGEALKNLEAQGLSENTIVIYNSDHGGVLPRSKRFLYRSGIHCPLIIRIPESYKEFWPSQNLGDTIDRMVSFIDMPQTWLTIAQTEVPQHMQGTNFLGKDTQNQRSLHFAYRGRMDERNENARSVCDGRFLYIRNYMPYVPWMQRLQYLWKMEATRAWEHAVTTGQATEQQSRYFEPKTWTVELYDLQKDPDNINNLAEKTEYSETVTSMRKALHDWQLQIHDSGLLPESEMVKRATDNDITIYELVRDPNLYNLPDLLAAADLALENDPINLPLLRDLLKNDDSGLRYWGIIGAFLLNDKKSGYIAIDDESHEVQAIAAWLLIRNSDKEVGLNRITSLLKGGSYASLKLLNILDWMGDEAQSVMPTLQTIPFENYEERMFSNLAHKFQTPRIQAKQN